jgi:hypothetical protein
MENEVYPSPLIHPHLNPLPSRERQIIKRGETREGDDKMTPSD